jgi:hypothetical protein
MVAVSTLDQRFFKLLYENREMNVRIYEVLNSLPRAYFAYCWEWMDSRADALRKIFEAEKSGFDPNKMTILEKPDGYKQTLLFPCKDKGESPANKVTILEDSGNTVSLTIEARRPGYLVLTDQYYPGWMAELDGKKSQILKANCFMRSVYVPEGKHLLRFSYQPLSFFVGLLICLAAIIWLLFLMFVEKSS